MKNHATSEKKTVNFTRCGRKRRRKLYLNATVRLLLVLDESGKSFRRHMRERTAVSDNRIGYVLAGTRSVARNEVSEISRYLSFPAELLVMDIPKRVIRGLLMSLLKDYTSSLGADV